MDRILFLLAIEQTLFEYIYAEVIHQHRDNIITQKRQGDYIHRGVQYLQTAHTDFKPT